MSSPSTSTRSEIQRRLRVGGDGRFRPDIEGLRAVAVMAVVFYHAGVGFLPGGYVGVDVFYVISGFLITDHLWREAERSGRLSLARFYARRARRLLPAAMVVLVLTMAWAAAVLPPLQLRSVWIDGLCCALYVGNFRFAATQTNYLANSSPSPFEHYWSLGVEEQFYLVWPLVMIIGSLMWWRTRPSRGAAAGVLAVMTVASLWLSIVLTRSDQPEAFFLLPSRAWELALGGLVALGSPWLRRLPEVPAAVLAWAGLGAIGVACLVFGAKTAFPGYAAALPVGGAAALITGGLVAPPGGPVLLLGRVFMRAIGRISYSWYLWHYPVLVLVPATVGRTLPELDMAGLAAGSAVLAVLTFRFVEEPGRRSAWLSARPGRSLTGGLALSCAGVLACLAAAATIPALHGHGQAPIASIRSSPSTAGPRPPGTATDPAAPYLHDLAADQAQVVAAVAASADLRFVPANLDPPLSSASASEAAPMVDGCLLSFTASAVDEGCLFGDTTSPRSVVLFGDSHAAMWFPAVDAWANAHSYRLYVFTKAACPPVHVTLFSPVLDRTWTECSQWYSDALATIGQLRPALVVLGIAPNYDSAYDVVQDGPAWLSGLATTLDAVRAAGGRVVVLGSVPSPPTDIPDCLSGELDDVAACEFSPVGQRVSGGGLVGIDQAGARAEATTVTSAGGRYVDVDPWFCTATTCDVIVDNLLVYRDNSHITVTYADYLSPMVEDAMSATLAGSGSGGART